MLVDEVKIRVSAGNGGNGAVAFNKTLMTLGPVGGSGGRGGGVFAEGIADFSALNQFRSKKQIKAEDGREGRGQFKDGYDGEDLILKIPLGTVVHNLTTGAESEITRIGERILLAKGGSGGKGNFHFRSSINTTPKQSQPGKSGEKFDFLLELKFIADIGFVGLPNTGKSSLLNKLTNAKSKVANYPFTTLEPNLGVYYELVLADIPGLIEGSSAGKGLGIKFLRHIERTKTLFHFISAESENPKRDYEIVRREFHEYKKQFLEKPEYIFLSKSDAVSSAELKKKMTAVKKINPRAIPISIYDDKSIETVRDILNEIKSGKFERISR